MIPNQKTRFMLYITFVSFLRASGIPKILNFGTTTETHRLLDGDSVNLVCEPCDTDSVEIFATGRRIVYEGVLVGDSVKDLEYVGNKTKCILKINQTERRHENTYWCFPNLRSLKIEVLYAPSGTYPVCSSSYHSYEYFNDSSQESFDFSCISGDGNPPINITLFTRYEDEQIRNKIREHSLVTTRGNNSVSVYYSPYLDSTFDNIFIVCSVTQQLPAPYQSYEKSCSFGPLTMLPTFSVSIHPSGSYTVNSSQPANITFTCSSNVSKVVLEWTSIPLEDWQYHCGKENLSLTLTIFEDGLARDNPLTVECTGIYGGRNISQTIKIMNDQHEEKKTVHGLELKRLLPFVLTLFVIVCMSIIVGCKVYTFNKRKEHNLKAPSQSSSVPGSEISSCSNRIQGKDVDASVRDNSNDPDIIHGFNNDTEMIENPIYGSVGKVDTSISNSDRNTVHSDIEMTENLIYESYGEIIEEMNHNEDPYADVSI